MSFVPATLPKVVRVLRPASTQYRCLYTPAIGHARSASVLGINERQCSAVKGQQQQRRAFHASPVSHSTKNPYDVLGVDKSASTSDIKKAYYAAAKKYHPDSSKEPNAREKFQEIQAAYEILSDPEKKQQFDQFGAAGFDPNGGFHPGGAGGHPGAGFGGFSGFGGGSFGAEFSFEDLFGAFTGGGHGRGGRRRNPFAEETVVGESIEVQSTISFMDAAKGARKSIHVQPLVNCDTCTGSGMRKGTSKKECGRCGGSGTRIHFMSGGFQMAATCESCAGSGVVIPPGSECSSCHGNGVVRESRTIQVDIPAGVEDGMRIRISGEGDAVPAGAVENGQKSKRGDLFVHIRVSPHPQFGRKGSDILYTATIPLTTALLGGTVKIPTLDNEVDLRVPSGTNTGDKITMSGMGMKKISGRRGGSGDLRVEFKVNMPKTLTTSQRTLLELLADEFKDKNARRIMNVSQFKDGDEKKDGTTSGGEQNPPPNYDANSEHHHGFLRKIWEKLSGGEEGKKP